MKVFSSVLLCVALVLTGCASHSDFFGMSVDRLDPGAFKVLPADSPGKACSYRVFSYEADDSVTALASVGYGTLKIILRNNSNVALRSNYFLDEVVVLSTDARSYVLNKPEILSYPEIINPGASAYYHYSGMIAADQVCLIAMQIGADTLIMLKPIPDPAQPNG